MQPNLAAVFVLFALMLLAILRWSVAMPLADGPAPARWPGTQKPDTEDEQPETDRAPRRLWTHALPAAVAVMAALRVALLFTLHA